MKELKTMMKGGPYKLESSFTTAWLKTLKDKGFYVDKISDGSIGLKKVDCYIRTDNESYSCEIKVVNKDVFPLDRLRANQWKSLRHWHELGGEAILVVYSKHYNDYKIIPFSMIALLDKESNVKLKFD